MKFLLVVGMVVCAPFATYAQLSDHKPASAQTAAYASDSRKVTDGYVISGDAANLPSTRKCLSAVDAQTGQCLFLVIGSSLSQSIIDAGGDMTYSSWPWQLAAMLNASTGIRVDADAFAGDGPAGSPRHLSSISLITAMAGNWTQDCSVPYLGGCLFESPATGSGAFAVTPAQPVDTCDIYVVGFAVRSGVNAGTISASLGTGTAAMIDTNSQPAAGYTKVSVKNALASQSLIITNVAGSGNGPVRVAAVHCWNSMRLGISIMNAAVGGWGTTQFLFDANSPLNPRDLMHNSSGRGSLDPNLCLIEMLSNDAPSRETTLAYKANLGALVNFCHAGGGDAIFITPPHGNDAYGHNDTVYAPFIAAMIQQAASMSQGAGTVPVIDIYRRMVSFDFEAANNWMGSGNAHLTKAGYADWARGMAQALKAMLGL